MLIFCFYLLIFAAIENCYHLSRMSVKFYKSSLSSAILLSLSTTALAEAPSDKEMETIVVSGTKTPKLLSNSPVAVDVIEGETIKLLTKGSLEDALDFIPGVLVERSPKSGYNIQMQGFDSKHVLVLLNSKPVITPTGSAVDLAQISAHNIVQIEVIKGASSVMYGSNAMGGVINIITAQDEDALNVTYEVGSYLDNANEYDDSRKLSHLVKVDGATTIGDWTHRFNLQLIREAGFDLEPKTINQDEGEVDRSFVNLGTATNFSDVNFDIEYQYLKEEKEEITGLIPGLNLPTYYTSDVDQHKLDALFHNIADNWKLSGRYSNHNEISGSATKREADIELAEIEGMKVFEFGNSTPKTNSESGAELVIGGVANYESMEQVNLVSGTQEIEPGSDRQNFSFFSQYNWIEKDYQVLAGVRAQDDSDFGFESAFRLSGLLNLNVGSDLIQIRMGAGQGYRVPDLKERFYFFDHSALGYIIIGNQDLSQETSESVSLSLDYTTSLFDNRANFSFSAASHFSDIDNLITTVINPEITEYNGLTLTSGAFEYVNVANAKIRGFDLSSELTFSQWQVQMNYAYVDTEDQDGDRLTGKPRHQLKLNLGYDFNEYDINTLLYLVYQAGEAVPDGYTGDISNEYATVNFKLNQSISNNLSWYMSLNNIFDEHQSPNANSQGLFDPRPALSRELRIGATYHF